MSRPLRVYNTSPFKSLREMSDIEIRDNIIYQILAEFAIDDRGTGALKNSTFGSPNDGIGTWSDRTRVYNVGDHGFRGVDNFTTSTYRIYQNITQTSEATLVKPICMKYLRSKTGRIVGGSDTVTQTNTAGLQTGFDIHAPGVPRGTVITQIIDATSFRMSEVATATQSNLTINFRLALMEMSDEDIDTYIITPALDIMTDMGLGSYYFSSSAPTTPSGSIWTSKFSLIDTYKPNQSATKTMWRFSSWNNLPAVTYRPLFYTQGNVNILGDEGLREMSNVQIRSLVTRFKNRLLSTGKGLYKFQHFAPESGGTWSQVGESISDLLNVVVDENYATTFTGFYKADYRKTFFGDYSGTFSGLPFIGSYRTSSQRSFGGSTAYYKGAYYSGVYQQTYKGTYTGSYTNYRTAQISHGYTSYFTGATISNSTASEESDALWIRKT